MHPHILCTSAHDYTQMAPSPRALAVMGSVQTAMKSRSRREPANVFRPQHAHDKIMHSGRWDYLTVHARLMGQSPLCRSGVIV